MNEQTFYKVCHLCGGEMLSYAEYPYSEYCLKYEIGVETKPHIGKLFAFRTLKDALALKSTADVVLSGTITGEVEFPPDRLPGMTSQYRYFWNHRAICHRAICYYPRSMELPTPKGTVFVESFTPQKIVLGAKA